MRVQEVVLEDKKKRYMLLNSKGMPIIAVVKFIKHLDNIGRSVNTQKTYCYALKLYFEYLEEIDVNYKFVDINILSNFMAWLRQPFKSIRVRELVGSPSTNRSIETCNLTLTVVTNFYDYLFRTEDIENDLIEKLIKQVRGMGNTSYKDFLYHINKNQPKKKNILKLEKRRKKAKSLTKEEVERIYTVTTNIRDKLLIMLLFETGLRIGEALSLFIEDFIFDYKEGHRINLVDRGELSNGAKLKTGERVVYISQDLMNLFDDYMYEVLDELEVDTNFVFVKLSGENKGKAMDYVNVNALFNTLKMKTNINIHAHLLRHTHATIYYRQTKDIKQVQERLGHAQIQTTMNLYVHPSDDDIRDGWKAAQPAFKIT